MKLENMTVTWQFSVNDVYSDRSTVNTRSSGMQMAAALDTVGRHVKLTKMTSNEACRDRVLELVRAHAVDVGLAIMVFCHSQDEASKITAMLHDSGLSAMVYTQDVMQAHLAPVIILHELDNYLEAFMEQYRREWSIGDAKVFGVFCDPQTLQKLQSEKLQIPAGCKIEFAPQSGSYSQVFTGMSLPVHSPQVMENRWRQYSDLTRQQLQMGHTIKP